MNDLGNKEIMAKNIKRFLDLKGKTRQEICNDLDFSYSTFTDWINANTYPRIDKIEMMANYFGIQKSDLVEEYNDNKFDLNDAYFSFAKEMQEKNVSKADMDRLWQFYDMIKKM